MPWGCGGNNDVASAPFLLSKLPGAQGLLAVPGVRGLPAKESTGVMLALLLIGDAIALWAYRRDANTAALRRLIPSVLTGVGALSYWR